MKRFRRLWRAMAALFICVGGFLTVFGVYLLLDPTSVIMYNGVPTAEREPKLFFTIFNAAFVAIGVGSLLVPSRWVDRMYVWRQSIFHALFSWR